MDWKFIIFSLVKIAIAIGVVQGIVMYSVLAERKISAWIQDRVGPNRTAPPFAKYIPVLGPFLTRLGIFQPLADGLKFLVKEQALPAIKQRHLPANRCASGGRYRQTKNKLFQ